LTQGFAFGQSERLTAARHLTYAPSFLTGGPDPGNTLCVFDP
jgi:hypothetical protein